MNVIQEKKGHHGYIDFIRFFSILLVIVLHCICDYFAHAKHYGKLLWIIVGFLNEFCRTGVPLFFMISGFLLLKSDIPDMKTFYQRRFAKILIPFICYDIFYYIFYCVLYGSELSVWRFVQELFYNGSAYHLWFMYSIAFMYLLIPFVKIIIDKCSFKTLIFFFIVITFQTTIKPFMNTVGRDVIYFYLTEDGIFGYLGYMVLGYILGKYDFSRRTEMIIYALGSFSFLYFPFVTMNGAMTENIFLFSGGYTLNHFFEAAAIFIFCKRRFNQQNALVSKLAALTMDAYFIHVFVLQIVKVVFGDFRPSVVMAIWIMLAVPLSFLWSWGKDAVFKYFKKLHQQKKLIKANGNA